MSRQVLLMVALLSAPALAQAPLDRDRTKTMLERVQKMVAVDADGCLVHQPDDVIVVCGTAKIDREQRLPFPILAAKEGERIREPLPKGNAEIVQQGRCYVTTDERNCFRGVPLFSVSLGGNSGVGGAAGRIWQVVDPEIPDADYVTQAMVKPLAPAPAD